MGCESTAGSASGNPGIVAATKLDTLNRCARTGDVPAIWALEIAPARICPAALTGQALISAHGEASTRRVIGYTMQRRASDIRIGNFEKVEISDFRSDAFCFLAYAAPDYLPVLTNWMQSPWFLKL